MSSSPSHRLKRVLGVFFGIAMVIGGTIGQGILRAPGQVAEGAPTMSAIILLWLVGGAISAIDAMSTVELATSIRGTGGPYSFTRRTFGPLTGLAVGATDWFANVASISFVSVVFAEYLHRLGIGTFLSLGAMAAAVPVVVGAIQWFGTRVSGRSQEIGSVLKAAIFAALIVALFLAPRAAPVTSATPSVAMTLGGLLLAIRAVYGTYYGWNGAAYFCEEVRDPSRAIVRATFGGIALVTGIYLLVNLAYLNVLTPQEMAGSKLVAADAAARVFGAAADPIVTAISLISLVTVINALVMQFSRVLFAVARDSGDVPLLSDVAPNGTPRAALAATVVASALLSLVGVYDLLLQFSLSLAAVMSVTVNLAAIRLRMREPTLERPYRMPLFPLPALAGMTVNLLLTLALLVEDWWTSVTAFAALAVIVTALFLLLQRTGRAARGVPTPPEPVT